MLKQKVVLVFAVMVTAAVMLVLVHEYSKLRTFTRMGDMWSLVHLREEMPSVFTEVDTLDFPEHPHPAPFDTLLTVNGVPATLSNYFTVFNPQRAAGDTIPITFLHAGEVFTTNTVTRSTPPGYRLLTQVSFALRVLIALGYFAIAYIGLLKRKPSSTVRSLVLFSLAMTASLAVAWGTIADGYASFTLPLMVRIILWCFAQFSWAFLLKLAVVFPRENASFRRKTIEALLFVPPMVIVVLGFIQLSRGMEQGNGNLLTSIFITVYCLLSLALLHRSSRRLSDPVERRQVRIVLMGALPGLAGQVALIWLFALFIPIERVPFSTRLMIGNGLFVLLSLLPASFLYAIRRYRLMALEARIKRSTRFLGVNLLLLLALIGVLWAFAELVLSGMNVTSQTPTLVLGLLLALGFGPTQRLIRMRLEERFFPERVKLRVLLRDFLASGMARSGAGVFWTELGFRLGEGLGARDIVPVLIRNGRCVEAVSGDPAPFSATDTLLRDLTGTGQPLPLDEIVASGRFDLTSEQVGWFRRRSAALLMPLCTGEGLLGFVAVGEKMSGEDYTSDELEILSALSGQMSLVVENLELLEERVRKESLERQMDLARTVQKRLLPVSLPVVPGCELAARIKPCLDVAGDYYDAFIFQDNRLLVAVGDVSGKGMGPALIMANLQASMRTALQAGLSLDTALGTINRMVFENTPDDMFITLFAACYSPSEGGLSFVNAGHNPPMLFRRSGETSILCDGGLLLGVQARVNYTTGAVKCSPGDTLLLYTDGVTEAMNPVGEEFGEDRLRSTVAANIGLPLVELLALIENKAAAFQGTDEFSDDFTLLALRKT
ncbi:MAG: SpoIIE family protein phosphatase [Candidatus Fermentibacteraceae bacterium]